MTTPTAVATEASGIDIGAHARAARVAARQLATTSVEVRDEAIGAIAEALLARRDDILAANERDLELAQELVARGELTDPLVKRLDLSGAKFAATVEMVRSVGSQPDPLGITQRATQIDDGLELFRISVPIGVIGVVFESRPDALVQIASLCLKSGNAVLMKGGREAAGSNQSARAVLLLAMAVSLGYVIWRTIWLEVVRELDDDEVALRVERRHPELRGRLISTIQLTRELGEGALAGSPELIEALETDTVSYSQALDFTQIISFQTLKKVGLAAFLFVLISGAAGYFNRGFVEALVGRMLLDGEAAYPTATRIIDSSVTRAYEIRSMPTTYFIKPDGEVLRKWSGLLTKDRLGLLIQELMAASGTS